MSHANQTIANPNWLAAIFEAKASAKGGILRRAVRDVDREVGRDAFVQEVSKRGWHVIESGGQYIIFCNQGSFRILC